MYSPNMPHGRMDAMFHRSSIGAVDEPIRLSPRTSGHYVPPASQYKSASLRLPHAVDDAAQYYSHKSSPALNAHQRSPRPSYPHHQNDEWKDTSYKYNQQAREERHATDPYTISGYESSRAGSYMKSVHQHDSLRPENSPYLTTKMKFRDRASKDAAFTSIEPRHASRLEETDVYAWDPNMQANITDPVGSQECFLPSTSYDTSHHRKHQTILPRALTLDKTAIKSSKAQPTVASPAAVHAHSSRLFAREARIREGSEIPERHDFRHERATSSTAAMMLSPNPVDEHTSPSRRSPHCAKDSVRYPSQSPSTQPNYGMVNTRFPLHSTSRKAQEKVMDHRGKQEEYHYLEHRTPDPLQEERIFGRSRIGGHRSSRDCYHQVDSVGSNLSEESDSVREERIPLREPHNRGSHPHSRNTRSRRTVNSEHGREEQSRERRCMETDGTVSDEEEGYIREDRQAAKHRLEHGRSSKANRYIVWSDGIEYEEAPRALPLPATISPRATSRHRRRTKPDRSSKQNSTRKPSDVPTSENAQRRHRSGSKDPKIRNHSRMQRSATRSASPYSRHSLEPSVPSSRTARGQNEDRGRIQENHKFDPLVRSGGVEQRCSIAQGSPHSPNDLQALDTLDDIRNRVLNIVAIGEQFDLAMQKAVSRNRKRQEGASEMAVARYECIQALTDSVKHIHHELIDLLETSQGASGM